MWHWCLKSMKSKVARAKQLCLKNIFLYCYQGLTLKNERMTLSRTQKLMYDQRLTEAYRPIWSPGLIQLNLKSLQPPALETAVMGCLSNSKRLEYWRCMLREKAPGALKFGGLRKGLNQVCLWFFLQIQINKYKSTEHSAPTFQSLAFGQTPHMPLFEHRQMFTFQWMGHILTTTINLYTKWQQKSFSRFFKTL